LQAHKYYRRCATAACTVSCGCTNIIGGVDSAGGIKRPRRDCSLRDPWWLRSVQRPGAVRGRVSGLPVAAAVARVVPLRGVDGRGTRVRPDAPPGAVDVHRFAGEGLPGADDQGEGSGRGIRVDLAPRDDLGATAHRAIHGVRDHRRLRGSRRKVDDLSLRGRGTEERADERNEILEHGNLHTLVFRPSTTEDRYPLYAQVRFRFATLMRFREYCADAS